MGPSDVLKGRDVLPEGPERKDLLGFFRADVPLSGASVSWRQNPSWTCDKCSVGISDKSASTDYASGACAWRVQ